MKIVEYRLVRKGWNTDIASIRRSTYWHKYREYKKDKDAEKAVTALNKSNWRGQGTYEYRLRPS